MKCGYCERRCDLKSKSYCGMYQSLDGRVVECHPNSWSSYHASHIEQIPFYHAYPGSRSFVIASAGCNMNCAYCINSYIAKPKTDDVFLFEVEPEKLVSLAKKSGCHNIVFGVNEVTVSLPSFIQVAKKAKESGMPVGCLSNGYMTKEAAQIMAEYISFINISLKSLSNDFYNTYAGVNDITPILRNIEFFAKSIHVEITTPIVQTVNDQEIDEIARYIKKVDANIPWHVFRLLPERNMNNAQYPDIDNINKVLKKARQSLPYIYFSNFVGSEWVSTVCPSCGEDLIERITLGACGGKLLNYQVKEGFCPNCGEKIPVLGGYVKWNAREAVK